MNRDDILRMAREAGCGWAHNGTQPSLVGEEMLERFANLVAAAAKAEEREACAQVCDDTDVVRFWHGGMEHDDGNRTLGNAAAAIRARGQQ